MKITVVCDVLGEENNGTTIAAMNLIRFLKTRGHETRVLCSDQTKKGEENFFVVPALSLGKALDKYIEKVGVSLSKPQEEIVRAALNGVDHVHVMLPFPLGMMAAKIAREYGLSVTAGFHMQAENLTSYLKMNRIRPLNKAVYKFIYKHFYQYVDAIHYPTEFIKNTFERNIQTTTKGYVISNGVHDYVQKRESIRPKEFEDKIIVLTTGRYAREKSQDTLLKAVALSKHKEKIQLILGGQGTKEKYYKKLAKRLPVPPVFQFFSRKEIIDILNYADIYVHPAEFELEGISCLEAVACGKLTIVSNSELSATKEFAIDEKCIFEKRNAKSLATVLDYWIEHPEERKIYEKKYLSRAIAYNQDVCMERMEEMFLETRNAKSNS